MNRRTLIQSLSTAITASPLALFSDTSTATTNSDDSSPRPHIHRRLTTIDHPKFTGSFIFVSLPAALAETISTIEIYNSNHSFSKTISTGDFFIHPFQVATFSDYIEKPLDHFTVISHEEGVTLPQTIQNEEWPAAVVSTPSDVSVYNTTPSTAVISTSDTHRRIDADYAHLTEITSDTIDRYTTYRKSADDRELLSLPAKFLNQEESYKP